MHKMMAYNSANYKAIVADNERRHDFQFLFTRRLNQDP